MAVGEVNSTKKPKKPEKEDKYKIGIGLTSGRGNCISSKSRLGITIKKDNKRRPRRSR